MEQHVKSPLGFEKNNFRSESVSWDLTIYTHIYMYVCAYMLILNTEF